MTAIDTTKRKNPSNSTEILCSFPPFVLILNPLSLLSSPFISSVQRALFVLLFFFFYRRWDGLKLPAEHAQRGVAWHIYLLSSTCSGCRSTKFTMGGVRRGFLHGLLSLKRLGSSRGVLHFLEFTTCTIQAKTGRMLVSVLFPLYLSLFTPSLSPFL